MKGIRELNIDELETVVGSGVVGGWVLCPDGTPEGGGAGLYPPNTACSTKTIAEGVGAFVQGFLNGGGTFPGGGGSGSGSGSGSGGYPA